MVTSNTGQKYLCVNYLWLIEYCYSNSSLEFFTVIGSNPCFYNFWYFNFFVLMVVGSLRAPPTSGAPPPPASGASHPSGPLAYSQFEHGDVQNGIPASAAPVQRCIWEVWIVTKSHLGRLVLGLDFLDLNQAMYFGFCGGYWFFSLLCYCFGATFCHRGIC